jgi:hypothetical protein
MGAVLDLSFRIEQSDDADSQVEGLIALAADHRVATAAHEAAPRPHHHSSRKVAATCG